MTVCIGARVTPELATELRRRAEAQETTLSRVLAGILSRALERDRADHRTAAGADSQPLALAQP